MQEGALTLFAFYDRYSKNIALTSESWSRIEYLILTGNIIALV